MKPFLKWPGGKYRLRDRILSALGRGNRLIEPFAGSAAVFLNAGYEANLLADSNPDLIRVYTQLIRHGNKFIRDTAELFVPENNTEKRYYALRDEFNACKNDRKRAALFIYLNRHCYNGLCRYNSKGVFNTPFGRYRRPRLPEGEMNDFIRVGSGAVFECADYQDTMGLAKEGDVVYCDPPYVPLSATSYFTDYHVGGFNWDDQVLLADKAAQLAESGIRVVISNHDTKKVKELYKERNATIVTFDVRRMISCDTANRNKVSELLAIFSA